MRTFILLLLLLFVVLGSWACGGAAGEAPLVPGSRPAPSASVFAVSASPEPPPVRPSVSTTDAGSYQEVMSLLPASAPLIPAADFPAAVRQAFRFYSDANGLLEPDPKPGVNKGAGNGVLYTSEEMVYFAKHGFDISSDRARLLAIVRSLQADAGLINRNPPTGYHDEQEGPDDYVGLAAAAHVLGGEAQVIAREIVDYGEAHSWFMNNARKDSSLDNAGKRNTSAVFSRFPQYLAHFHWCAGRDADSLSEIAWAVVMANGATQSPDQVALQWLMMQCLPSHPSPTVKAAAVSWARRFRQHYPQGIGEVMARSFKPGHPLIVFAPPIEDFQFLGTDNAVQPIVDLLINEGKKLLNDLEGLGDATKKLAVGVWHGNGKEVAAAVTKIAARLAESVTVDVARRAADTATAIVDAERAAARTIDRGGTPAKVGVVLLGGLPAVPLLLFGHDGPCEKQRDVDYGACERAIEPASGSCDSHCAECDAGIDQCFNECNSHCDSCPSADQSQCHHDCDTECDRCGSDGCRGAICNDAHKRACYDGCSGRANSGAGCRGAWCGDGEAAKGCRNGCTGRRNAAAGCSGAWCGDGQARVGCHNGLNSSREDCKRRAEDAYGKCPK